MSEPARRRGKVLVVDDDDQYLKLTARMLSDAGYEVVTRGESIGTSAAVVSERPDLVLMDLNMPGLDGDRLAALIQRSGVNRPVLVLYSGMNEKVLGERALGCGADATIPKGIPHREFLEQIARLFARVPGAHAFGAPREK